MYAVQYHLVIINDDENQIGFVRKSSEEDKELKEIRSEGDETSGTHQEGERSHQGENTNQAKAGPRVKELKQGESERGKERESGSSKETGKSSGRGAGGHHKNGKSAKK